MTRRQAFKVIFHKDTLMLVASIVFLWFAISLIVDSNREVKDFDAHTGEIEDMAIVAIKVTDKPFFKQVTKELRVTLKRSPGYFTSITTKDFGDVTAYVHIGDTVTIYTKPKVWGIFGMKSSNDISQLTKGRVLVIDYKTYQKSISGLYVLMMLASIVFFVIYLVQVNKRYYFDISDQP